MRRPVGPGAPDLRLTAVDAITAAGGTVAVHTIHEPLVRILLAAADDLRAAGPASDAVGARDLVGAIVTAVARHGDPNGYVADAQADGCYALLGAALRMSPLMWSDRPDSTRERAVTALTAAARKAATA